MPAPDVDVSVLVPVLDEEPYVEQALAAMRAQDFEGSVEYLLIDGRSSDRTREIVERLAGEDGRIRLLDNPQRVTPVALNIGLAAARGAYVARMDAHTHYPPNYLSAGVARLRRGGVAHVSGPQIAYGTNDGSRRVARALATRLGSGGAAFRHAGDEEFPVDSGFTGIWERATLTRLGGWAEEWVNDQDSELAARIHAEGGVVLCLSSMAARYIPRDSLERLARQYWRYGFFRVKTWRRHPETMRRSHVFAPGLALTAVAAVLPLGPLSRAARAGLALYAATVLATSAGQAREAGWRDALALPAVFAGMHFPYGFGALAGSVRFGVPWRALARLLRGGGS